MPIHITAAPTSILVKREGALGDVFDVTPVTARLAAQYPGADIHVQTAYPGVFKGNPHARALIGPPQDHDLVVDLNMAFEHRLRRMSAIDAYMEEAFGDRGEGHSKALVYNYDKTPPAIGVDWSRAVVFHPARSWPQRTLPLGFWYNLVGEFIRRDYTPVRIGTAQDWHIEVRGVVNTSLTLEQQVAAIGAASVYVGSASGPCHYAAATDTPIVSLLTMSPAYAVAHERHGVMGWGFRGIEAKIECIGCGGRQTTVNTFYGCERGDNACVHLFDPAAVADAAVEMAEQFKR